MLYTSTSVRFRKLIRNNLLGKTDSFRRKVNTVPDNFCSKTFTRFLLSNYPVLQRLTRCVERRPRKQEKLERLQFKCAQHGQPWRWNSCIQLLNVKFHIRIRPAACWKLRQHWKTSKIDILHGTDRVMSYLILSTKPDTVPTIRLQTAFSSRSESVFQKRAFSKVLSSETEITPRMEKQINDTRALFKAAQALM